MRGYATLKTINPIYGCMDEDMIPMESTNPIGLYERAIEGANARGIYTDATTIIEVYDLPDTHTHDRC